MPLWHVAAHVVVDVTTSSRVRLGWEVPDDRWAEYTAKVEDEWGESSPYQGIQIEVSWREYRDIHPLEDHANRLLEAAGLSRETDEKNNLSGLPSLAGTESNRRYVRVHEDVKQEMEQYAAAHNLSKHEVLRGVIAWYLGGSVEERVIEKLDRVVPEAERAFAEVTGDDSDAVEDLNHTERLTRKIARSLGDNFRKDNLENAIDSETTGTKHYHEKFTQRVVEYKNVKRWETDEGPDHFLTPETWKTRQTREIEFELGAGHDTPPPPFTPDEFKFAAGRVGIDTSPNNQQTVYEYRDRLLDSIGFEWSDETEKFEPVDYSDGETESKPNLNERDEEEVSNADKSDPYPDADTESTTATRRMEELEQATQVRADGGDSEE